MIAPGDLLQNRYRVLHSLGEGGFGQVFEIEENGILKVLKVLNPKSFPSSQHQKAIELFRREVEILSKFHHAGIPQIEPEGYFVLEQGNQPPLHCLVMEKISGVNLQQWQQTGGTLSQHQAIDWLKQLINILNHLHQHQFFHRDIKPSNIMLRSNGQLALIDFGAVREVTATYLVKQQQETGTAIISAGYTPPEQAEGQAVPQSDFFALGRTFVYLLTGKAPLDLPKDSQTGQLLWRDRTLKAINLSPLFVDLIESLMAPMPGQRPQSCEVILQVLQNIERRLFLQQWLPGLVWLDKFYWRSKRGDQSQVRFEFLALLIASSVLSSGVSIWSNRHEIAITLNDRGLKTYDAENRIGAQFLYKAQLFYQFALLLNPQEPSARFNLGELYEALGQIKQARAAYEIAVEMEVPEAHNNLARLDILEQNYDQALILLQDGLNLLDSSRNNYSSENFINRRYALLKNLGWAQVGLNQQDEAEKTLRAAIDLKPNQAAPHCLLAPLLMRNVKISDALIERDLCFQYADLQNPDDRTLSELARDAFPPSEVQP